MNKKLQKWAEENGKAFREISQDISQYGKELKEKVNDAVSGQELSDRLKSLSNLPLRKKAEKAEGSATPAQNSPETVRKEVADAIHRAYYKEGGFRHFGCNLQWYVRVALPQETELALMWAAGYNTHIYAMLRQLEKLETELMEIRERFDRALPVPENKALLEQMRLFKKKAIRGYLHLQTGWEPEEYADALRQYAAELSQQLLEPYQLPKKG